ncbi:MAG: hypothetical protein KAU17_05210 [Spirochaetales bacterium]|nr:hypothetical protein [Spirochaetales bacterium]
MKRALFFIIAILLLLIPVTVFAQDADTRAGDLFFTIALAWDSTLRVGVEYRITPSLGIRAGVGGPLLVLINALINNEPGLFVSYDLLGVYYFTFPESPWEVGLTFGIPNAGIVIYQEPPGSPWKVASMHSFGGGLTCGYRFTDAFTLKLRIGGGYPFFYEDGVWETRDMFFWPDLAVEGFFRL